MVSPSIYEKYLKQKKVEDDKKTLVNRASGSGHNVNLPEQSNLNSKISNDDVTIEIEDYAYSVLMEDYGLDDYEQNAFDLAKTTKLDALNDQFKEELIHGENVIKTLKENAQKFEKIVNQVKKNAESSPSEIAEAQNVLANSVDTFLKNDELVDKITQRLSEIIDELDEKKSDDSEASLQNIEDLINSENTADSLIPSNYKEGKHSAKLESILNEDRLEEALVDDVNLNNWKLKASVLYEEKITEESGADQNQKLKELEDSLSKKLSQSDKSSESFKKIKVKIITVNKDSLEDLKSLNDEETNSLSALITSLFQNSKQKEDIKRLQNNYNQIYDEASLESTRIEPNEDKKSTDGFLNVFDDEFKLEPENEEDSEEDNKLIIY